MPNEPAEKAQNSAGIPLPPKSRLKSSPVPSIAAATIVILGITALFLANYRQGGFLHRSRTSADDSAIEQIPAVRFTDITTDSGIHFVHNNGAYGEKLLPETTGGGCAFFDFDNDGNQDILFVNSSSWPWKSSTEKPRPTLALYRNDGHGHFLDVTAASGLDANIYGMGVAVGDYDNDGLVDLYITAVGTNYLFRNLGQGKFVDSTADAEVSGGEGGWSTSAAWIDYDNDGFLDLFVCNYVRWSHEIDLEVNYQLPGIGRAYGPPMNFVGTFPYLFHNEGNGRFRDVSSSSGIQVRKPGTTLPMAKSLGVAPIDFDGDGWMDLIVANDTVQNFAFQNQHNGTFKEVGALKGLAYSNFGGVRGAMGIDTCRFQDNDNLAVAIGNFANEMTALYVTQQDPFVFSDEALQMGIGSVSKERLTFGVFFFDYDLDGWLDLLTANGHIEPDIAKVQPNQQYKQPAQLFWNAHSTGSSRRFVAVPTSKCGPDLFTPLAGRGSAYADIDGDGDLDVIITQIGGPPLLLRNDQKLNHHWVRFKLTGVRSNRDAIGSWVKVRVDGKTLSRQVMPTRGFLSQSELPITFGLGAATQIDEVSVTWPGGAKQQVAKVPIDSTVEIRQEP